MTREEFEQYKILNNKFLDACYRYVNAMSEFDPIYSSLDHYFVDDNKIIAEFYTPTGYEYLSKTFDVDNIFMTDNELANYVNSLIEKRLKEEEKRKKEYDKINEKHEREMYEKLKKKYG